MKVLITGGAGFIGSTLADRLTARGDTVLVMDNYATGRRDNVTAGPRLEIVEGTIADEGLVQSAFDRFKPEIVVHAAASYKDPEGWEEDARTNALGTVNIVRAAKKVGALRLIYFQTALCYGLKPIEQPITLSHPVKLEGSSYAISKTAGEAYIALSGMDFISFRLANAYGPRNLSGPLPTFYSRLTSGRKCFVMNTRRDFIFVDDLVDAVVKAVDGTGSKGYYHISSGSDFSIEELYDSTVKALKLDPAPEAEKRERNPDDVFSILLDPSSTEKDFNWKTSTPLQAGIAKTVAYYQQFGISQTYTHLKQVNE
ncbi:MAG: NAD-dependent epimerase/dehydratase family protein [Nitrospinae bacterium]|nr:NAD-dependent epimerase/dehydratase family protein [Nitrospinota bacterium]